ncbi:hypothetical protein NPA07_04645 [Mycoplasmopsis caviae]|uniref:Uncharacterized protein n=1 Tax=Mycoplasmopsis caviae TaxID=55603 RepID=A0A3P8KMR0_9BACT|nr:hypothetical protein [Mycoplasmopsis caviae]UUD35066.1 hypothetical protein NPA07_04645 [Mycoplasmopsis caviae]VDR42108.1 Uncharacterised protein [Mycoplasmopsis caviae]
MKKTIYEIEARIGENKFNDIYRKFLINSDISIMELGLITASSFRANFTSFPDIYFLNKKIEKKIQNFSKREGVTVDDVLEYGKDFIGDFWYESYEYEFEDWANKDFKKMYGFDRPKQPNPQSPKTKVKKILTTVGDSINLYYNQIEIVLTVKNIVVDQKIEKNELQLNKYYFKVLEAKYYGFIDDFGDTWVVNDNAKVKKLLTKWKEEKFMWPSNQLLMEFNKLEYMSDEEFIKLLKNIANKHNDIKALWIPNFISGNVFSKRTKKSKDKVLHKVLNAETFDCNDSKIDELNEYALVWAVANMSTIFLTGFDVCEISEIKDSLTR